MRPLLAALLAALLVIGLSSALPGCKKAEQPPAAQPPAPKPQAALPPELLQPEVAAYTYNPAGKPDPMRPFGTAKPAEKKLTESEEVKASGSGIPLQSMEVGQLTLVGVATSPMGNRALVQDSAGRGYILTVGSLIGSQAGIVREISPERVVVVERVPDYIGRLRDRPTVLKLQRSE
jgi:type IV pilus assembly protein PilP